MSRSVDLFIGSTLPIDRLAELLRQRSGAQLIPTIDPDRWRFIDGGLTAELFEHPYVDDGELWLSRYRYVLSARMAEGIGPIDSTEVLGLRHLAQVLHHPTELPVLLVLDLQYRIEPATPPTPREVARLAQADDDLAEDGFTEDGITEDGITEDGITEDGITEGYLTEERLRNLTGEDQTGEDLTEEWSA